MNESKPNWISSIPNWLKAIGALVVAVVAVIPVYYGFFYFSPKTVVGAVRDNTTNNPVGGVTVTFEEERYITGNDGVFFFTEAIKEKGRYQLFAEKEGYESYSGVVTAQDKDEKEARKDIMIVPTGPTGPRAKAEIEIPKDGEHVEQSIIVRGRASGVPQGHHLWLFVHPVGSAGWWPQGSEFFPPSWIVQATVGGAQDVGKTFEIAIVLADEGAHSSINQYLKTAIATGDFPETPLPSGVELLDNIIVERR